jgi:Protein of unknown function (DUF2905)
VALVEWIGKVLLIAAAVLAVIGGGLVLASKLGLDRLPGDIVIRREGLTIYIPLGVMVVVSVAGTLLLLVLRRL